jgi:hypothetical protein
MLTRCRREVRSGLSAAVAKVIDAELQESAQWGLEGLSRSAKDYNEAFVTQHGGKSLLHAVRCVLIVTCAEFVLIVENHIEV